MLFIIFIIFIIYGLFLIAGIFYIYDDNLMAKITGITLIIAPSIVLGLAIKDFNSIDPIEVYRGNTQLKIIETKIDSTTIKLDSIVILKNK